MASSEVRNPQKEIPKATLIVTLGILILYVASAFVLTLLVNWDTVNTNESPFISALSKVGIGPASDVINTVILISTVSVMLASFYSSTRMLVSLSRNHRLFAVFTKETHGHLFRNAWIFVSFLTLLIIGVSLLVSSRLFNYLVSASSYFTFFNWTINLLTYLIWRKRYKNELKYKSPLTLGNPGIYVTLAAILLLFAFSLSVQDFRIGFYISLIIFILISFIYWIGSKRKSN
jgi:L-asparagine transporter-like permease